GGTAAAGAVGGGDGGGAGDGVPPAGGVAGGGWGGGPGGGGGGGGGERGWGHARAAGVRVPAAPGGRPPIRAPAHSEGRCRDRQVARSGRSGTTPAAAWRPLWTGSNKARAGATPEQLREGPARS